MATRQPPRITQPADACAPAGEKSVAEHGVYRRDGYIDANGQFRNQGHAIFDAGLEAVIAEGQAEFAVVVVKGEKVSVGAGGVVAGMGDGRVGMEMLAVIDTVRQCLG